ncbi:MAG: tetratricopeptide repeat protein, partial [Thermodesulfobacteriota bacterium]
MRELKDEVASKADRVLENYYRTRGEEGDISAVLETIYHTNRLDWKRGATDWVKTFERALKLSHFELCRALLDVRMELSISEELERGQIANCAADYFACLSRYAEAKQEYLDAIQAFDEALRHKPENADVLNMRAISLRGIGELAASFSRFKEAARSYEQTIACFDQALAHAPDDVGIRDNKGWALMKRGELEAELSQYEEAAESYRLAVAAFE